MLKEIKASMIMLKHLTRLVEKGYSEDEINKIFKTVEEKFNRNSWAMKTKQKLEYLDELFSKY